MRTLSTIIVGLLAVVAFCVFFGLHSAISYVDSPTSVTETAERHALHKLVLEAADRLVSEELRRRPGPRQDKMIEFVRNEARVAFNEILSKDWFYEALSVAYRTVLAILYEREVRDVIDLRDKKARLLRELGTIDQRITAKCRELLDGPICDDEAGRRRMLAPIRQAVTEAVEQIPDELHVQSIAEAAGQNLLRPDSREMVQARKAMGLLEIVRLAALGALLLFLLVIGLSNRPLPRVLLVLGIVLAVCSGSYLIGAHVADDKSRDVFAMAAEKRARVRIDRNDSSVRGIAARGAQDLTAGVAHDALHHADGAVMAIGIFGLAGVFGGVFLGRRRSRRGAARE